MYICICVCVYITHEMLQYVYYVQCRATLLQVILFRNSDLCVTLRRTIEMLEGNVARALS